MEIWRDVIGWEGLYEVSSLGNVRSKTRLGTTNLGVREYGGFNVKALEKKSTGYLCVNLTSRGRRSQESVHRLVLQAFVGLPSSTYEACHNDGDRKNNRVENLRWDSRKNNHADKKKHGTWQVGSNNGSAKINESQALEIKHSKSSVSVTAKKYGIGESQVVRIRNGISWPHI